jgi:hypothetical protein
MKDYPDRDLTRRQFAIGSGILVAGAFLTGSLVGCQSDTPEPPALVTPADTVAPVPETPDAPSVAAPDSFFGTIKIDDTITLGNYGGQDIIWRVLAVENGKALVITEDIIDLRPYNKEYEVITWEQCTLRKWLNSDFFSAAFSSTEGSNIAKTTLPNPANPDFDRDGGPDTADQVFLLSLDEANRYFKSDTDRRACVNLSETLFNDVVNRLDEVGYNADMGRDDAALSSTKAANGQFYPWWLRSPGGGVHMAACVMDPGYVNPLEFNVNAYIYGGVRPALWLNL